MNENEVSNIVIGAAIEVHRILGPGLLESAYQRALKYEIGLRGLPILSEVKLAARYKEIELEECYRIDLLVADLVVVEIKAVEHLSGIHEVQLLTYLRFSGKKLGILLNFNSAVMKNGIRRVLNGELEATAPEAS